MFDVGDCCVVIFFLSFLTCCLFSLGVECNVSDAPSEVLKGPPSEIGGSFLTCVGMIPGVFVLVFLLWTLGVFRISVGCVGFVDVWGCCVVGWSGKFSVLLANILANAASALVCLPGFRTSNPCIFLIALSKSFATLVEQTFRLLTIVLSNYECWPWCWPWPYLVLAGLPITGLAIGCSCVPFQCRHRPGDGMRKEVTEKLKEGSHHELVSTITNAKEAETGWTKFHGDRFKRGEADVIREEKILELHHKFHHIVHLEITK